MGSKTYHGVFQLIWWGMRHITAPEGVRAQAAGQSDPPWGRARPGRPPSTSAGQTPPAHTHAHIRHPHHVPASRPCITSHQVLASPAYPRTHPADDISRAGPTLFLSLSARRGKKASSHPAHRSPGGCCLQHARTRSLSLSFSRALSLFPSHALSLSPSHAPAWRVSTPSVTD